MRGHWRTTLVLGLAAVAAVVIVLISPWASEQSSAEIVRDACAGQGMVSGLDTSVTSVDTRDGVVTSTTKAAVRYNAEASHQLISDEVRPLGETFVFVDGRYYRRVVDDSGQWQEWEFYNTNSGVVAPISTTTFCGVKDLVNVQNEGREMLDGVSVTRYSGQINPDTLPEDTTEHWDFWIDSRGLVQMRQEIVETEGGLRRLVTTTKFHGFDEPNIIAMNLPPVFAESVYVFSISSLSDNAFVGRISASDPEGDTVTYSISPGDHANRFAIAKNTGEVKVAAGGDGAGRPGSGQTGSPAVRVPTTYSFAVRATDASGGVTEAPVSINLAGPTATPTPTPTLTPSPTPTPTPTPTPVPLTAPDAPANLAAAPERTAVGLRWEAVTGAARYRVEHRPADGTWTTDDERVAASPYQVTGLTCATAYEFRVSAYGDGSARAAGWGTAATLPASTAACSPTPTPTLEPLSPTVEKYDQNGNGRIEATEYYAALRDYGAGKITYPQVLEVAEAYQRSSG